MRVSRPLTEIDVKMQSDKHEFYTGALIIVVVMGGLLGFLTLLVILAR